jgi:hypothetical protein
VLDQLAEARAAGSFGSIGGLEKNLAFNPAATSIFDGLVARDAKLDLVPALAEGDRITCGTISSHEAVLLDRWADRRTALAHGGHRV